MTEGKTLDIRDLLEQAVTKQASDLHLTVGRPPTLRIDGELVPISGQAALAAKDLESPLKHFLD